MDSCSSRPNAPVTVSVRLSPRAAQVMSAPTSGMDRDVWGHPLWTERPLLIRRPDTSADLIATTRCPQRVARWLLQFGGEVTAESPPALRHCLAAHVEALWLTYAGDDAGP